MTTPLEMLRDKVTGAIARGEGEAIECQHAEVSAAVARAFAVSPRSCAYGAPMGRHSQGANPVTRLFCFKIPLDAGGYDPGGPYWGVRKPGFSLYAVTDGIQFVRYVDARCRRHALAEVLDDCVNVGWHGPLLPDERYSLRRQAYSERGQVKRGWVGLFCGNPITESVWPDREDAALTCWSNLAERIAG